ncbi:MAG: hypothetical protein R3F02_13070 [Thiolinea sp.]
MNVSQSQAAGLRSLPNKVSSFASTQAAWRFYDNERVTLPALAAPLLERAHLQVERYCTDYALCVHDWSRLNYRRHSNKSDRYPMTHETDVGYELQSSLLVSDTQGLLWCRLPIIWSPQSTSGQATMRQKRLCPGHIWMS